jgi:DNA invertase Pin-like site-specific DNA recombinase
MTHQVVGYIRVSTHTQNTARQLQGIKLDKEFVDKMSGSSKDREGLAACVNYVRQGDVLVVESIDRLARNLRDLQEIVESLIKKGVEIRFIKENLSFTGQKDAFSTLMLQMMGSFAEFERTMIKARQREGIEAAKREGRTGGRPAKITPLLIAKAKGMIEDGESIRKTAMALKVSRMTIYKILGRYATKTNWEFNQDENVKQLL